MQLDISKAFDTTYKRKLLILSFYAKQKNTKNQGKGTLFRNT